MMTIKNTLGTILASTMLLAGCQYQQPEYVRSITPSELRALMQLEDVFLVDVHTPEQRHIRNTDAFVPYDQVGRYRDRFPGDPSTPIYLYCESGGMANAAARTLHEFGYRNLFNLSGGAAAWRAAGYELDG
ncbi:MAG: rhodanese-like domain-containing protein [Methylotetracoccus sp.]